MFRQMMDRELERMKSKNYSVHGYHEAFGLILEELDEFWEEVRKKSNKRDPQNCLKELSQIAALAERSAIDLGLLDGYESASKNGKKYSTAS